MLRSTRANSRTLQCCAVFGGSREGHAVAERALKLTLKGHGSGREMDGQWGDSRAQGNLHRVSVGAG
jgi:hypothetical protein